jgi:adenylate cyclase
LTKYYGVEILITESTNKLLSGSIITRELDLIAVKGKELPDVIYEVVRNDHPSSMVNNREKLSDFAEALKLFRTREWHAALVKFDSLCKKHPNDRPLQIYFERSKNF